MDPLNARNLRQFEGKTFTEAELAAIPLMPDRSVNSIQEAIADDLQTYESIGTFRRKLDQYDAQMNPCIPDTTCVYAVVTVIKDQLCVLPLGPPPAR